jgi:predicted RNase H-like HicB family nuclease
MQYNIIIEKAERNYSAYVPDLPGCVATGATIEEVTQLIREGIALHLEDMIATGQEIPAPSN